MENQDRGKRPRNSEVLAFYGRLEAAMKRKNGKEEALDIIEEMIERCRRVRRTRAQYHNDVQQAGDFRRGSYIATPVNAAILASMDEMMERMAEKYGRLEGNDFVIENLIARRLKAYLEVTGGASNVFYKMLDISYKWLVEFIPIHLELEHPAQITRMTDRKPFLFLGTASLIALALGIPFSRLLEGSGYSRITGTDGTRPECICLKMNPRVNGDECLKAFRGLDSAQKRFVMETVLLSMGVGMQQIASWMEGKGRNGIVAKLRPDVEKISMLVKEK